METSHRRPHQPAPRPGLLARVGWTSLGLLAVGVGGIGIVVPGLPTTVFFVVAAWAFSKSNPRLEAWVLGLPGVGPLVQDYRAGLGMPRGAKITAVVMIVFFVGLSAILVDNWFFRTLVVAAGLIGLAVVLFGIPTKSPGAEARVAEQSQVDEPEEAEPSGRAAPLPGRILRRAWKSRALRVIAVVILLAGLFVKTQEDWIEDQLASYVTDTRSPEIPPEWLVDANILRGAAEASRGTHDADGAIRHTVDYPFQLLDALETPSFSVEANVTVIDGEGFLQHDPRVPIGMPLLEFLEYAAIAEFPIVKLDLKRDRVGTIIEEVREAVDRFGLDPRRVHFNADVFRGPDVKEDIFGARTDKSFTDRMYNLIVMELETSDLIRIAREFPESTIVISSTTPTGPREEGYSDTHLERFVRAAQEVREASPGQALVFSVRGDLAARSDPGFLEGLNAVEDSYVAAWWSADVPPRSDEIDTMRDAGVTFLDLGEGAHD